MNCVGSGKKYTNGKKTPVVSVGENSISKLWQTRQKRRFTKRCYPENVDRSPPEFNKVQNRISARRKFWEVVAKLWTRRCQRKEKRELKVLSRRSHAAALFPHAPKHWQTYMWGIARDRPSQSSQGDCEGKRLWKEQYCLQRMIVALLEKSSASSRHSNSPRCMLL